MLDQNIPASLEKIDWNEVTKVGNDISKQATVGKLFFFFFFVGFLSFVYGLIGFFLIFYLLNLAGVFLML